MRLDKLTIKAREVLVASQDLAARTGQPEVVPEHILSALLSQQGGIVAPLLRKLGADPQQVQQRIAQEIDRLPKQQGGLEVGLSRRARDLVESAEREAEQFKDEYTSTEHLLLALAHHDFGAASRALKEAAVTPSRLLAALADAR